MHLPSDKAWLAHSIVSNENDLEDVIVDDRSTILKQHCVCVCVCVCVFSRLKIFPNGVITRTAIIKYVQD